jgi:putative transposase
MARIARVVVPGLPHHIVQRGNRNQTVFFSDSDRYMYALMLKNAAGEYGVSLFAIADYLRF